MDNSRPATCVLCNAEGHVRPARFEQTYPQADGPGIAISWWECTACRGWFACPLPTTAMIENHWQTVRYADAGQEAVIAAGKRTYVAKLLQELESSGRKGRLLDVGCNTGSFMAQAAQRGWQPTGYDPNPAGVAVAKSRGFDARNAWQIDQCGFSASDFDAITVTDVFCYSRHPYSDLRAYYELLRPGGVLAMRLTNKRAVVGLAHRLTFAGARRNAIITTTLQGQYHMISMPSLTRILLQIGFRGVVCKLRAMTAPPSEYRWSSRVLYGAADCLHGATLGKVNLSPGVMLVARKP